MTAENVFKQSRIMIVDDDPLTAGIVQRYLNQAGFPNTRTVTDSRTVLKQLGELDTDMVLLDIFMPEVSGLDLLREIKSRPELDEVIVLMLSSADADEQYRSLEMGAAGFIKKPVTEEISNHVVRAFDVARRLGKLIQMRESFQEDDETNSESFHVTESI